MNNNKELCKPPFIERLLDGAEVEWKPLGEVAKIVRGVRVTKNKLKESGFPVVSGGIGYMGYLDEYNREANTITIAQYGTAGYVKLQTERFWANDVCFSVFPNQQTTNKFLYYILSNKQEYLYSISNRSAIPYSISKDRILKILIPIPPLHVQEEIVRILDKFTTLEAELEAELDCRKRQYEYYRNQLLSFNVLNGGGQELNNVTLIPLGKVGEICMCKRILKGQTSAAGDVAFYKIGTFGKTPNAYISRKLFNEYKSKYSYPRIGEVLISASGTIGRTVIFDGKEAYFQDSNIVWIKNDESQVLNKYLFYCYQIVKWNVSEGGTIQRLYNDNLKKTLVPIPYLDDRKKSLAEQERIVSILDKFETLTTSISEGLPKEIELRRKQYEYYRNQLLSFKTN